MFMGSNPVAINQFQFDKNFLTRKSPILKPTFPPKLNIILNPIQTNVPVTQKPVN